MTIRDIALIDAAVPRTATFREAAERLCGRQISAVAVLDDDRRVIGLFTEDDLIAGLFPRYLKELRHTAFTPDAQAALERRSATVGSEPVTAHMRAPVTLDIGTSATHAAERFLHCEWGALAVLEGGRYVGMLQEVDFARALLPSVS